MHLRPPCADEKRLRLRAGLRSMAPVVTVGAHNALTAKLIERYGFDAVWVSGLGVSAMAYALPDLNLISMTEALDAARRIDAATELPVIADCDNGFGGFSNVVRTVVEYERAGIAGISIEDNAFPKRNSLYRGETRRELIPVDEQARRIRAGKRAQSGEAFVIIARIESLIAGYGLADAWERADAYVRAGADAILIHSRDETLAEIDDFLSGWSGTYLVPLVAVPTSYPTFTAAQLAAKGFNMIILANQPMRAAVRAMEETLRTMREHGNAASVEGSIASVDHIFDLVGTTEVIEAEERITVTAR
ncbi:MAG: isocitrate lyase/phosphoenolpyruvate mutase family protein [Egibacteraceae bacterium]